MAAHSFNIRLPDAQQHGYAQKYCFLNGPDVALNEHLRQAVIASRVPLRDEQDSERIAFLSVDRLTEIQDRVASGLPSRGGLDLSERELRDGANDLAWKVDAIPQDARSVLVLGSSTCREAVFIRARLPHARILCTDFEDHRIPNVESLGIEFHQGNFNELLASSPAGFDVVFSNHVLEHLFDPELTLGLIRRALAPGGVLVSALPLDGQPSAPFSDVLNTSSLHPLDMCTVDVAHAWKTNVSELTGALRAAGFEQTEFFGRDKYFSVSPRTFGDRTEFNRRARLGILLNKLVFGSTRGVLKKVFPRDVPRLVTRGMFGIEHRVWFGSNRLKNDFTIECLVVAR